MLTASSFRQIRIIGTRVLLMVALSATSASSLASADAKRELKRSLATIKTLSSDYQQIIKEADGTVIGESSGALALMKPNRFRWQQRLPDELTIVADGNSLYHLDPFVEQVTIYDQASAMQENPFYLLLDEQADWSDISVVSSRSDLLTIPPELLNDSVIDRPDLRAFEARFMNDANQQAAVGFLFSREHMLGVWLEDIDQQRSSIILANPQYNQELQNAEFVVRIPEAFTIDDQRQ